MGKGAAIAVRAAGGIPWIVGRDEAKLSDAAKQIGGDVKTSSVDAFNEEAVAKFFEGVPQGSVHHLVVTLGASAHSSSIQGKEGFASLRRQFDMKFFGQMMPVSYGAEKIADGGSIVLTSGALSRRPGKGSTALACANAALEAIIKGLANDFGPRLRVNCVSPGLTNTEMWAGMPAEKREGMLKGFGSTLPLGRAGESEDVGNAIRMLLEANYTTGATFDCDGGAVYRP